MTRAILSAAIDSDWKQVTPEKPCPVCGSFNACSVHVFEEFACCSLAPSEWKLTTGAWLHRIIDNELEVAGLESKALRGDSATLVAPRS
jgi:hypothetical protein